MNHKILLNKILAIAIILLFFSVSVTPIISAISFKQNIDKTQVNNENQDTSTLTFYTFDKSGMKQQIVRLPKSVIESISIVFEELKYRFEFDPLGDETQALMVDFVDLLDLYDLIPEGLSRDDVFSLVNPPRFRFLERILSFTCNTPFLKGSVLNFLNSYFNFDEKIVTNYFDNQDFSSEVVLMCNIASLGLGIPFPFFMLPRPRGVALWAASSGYTAVGSLLQAKNFIAWGNQQGVALGFVGFGISAYFGWFGYALIGYAGLLIINAETITPVEPPNRAPEISDVSPSNGAVDVSISLDKLSFRISDFERNRMDYVVTTSPDIGSGSGENKKDGVYSIPVSGLQSHTKYTWHVAVNDDYHTTEKTFSFTTEKVAPVVSDPIPEDGETFVPVDISELSFRLRDFQGDLMDYTVETFPDVGSGSGSGVGDGVYSVDVSGLHGTTEYSWFVNATDGVYWTHEVFSFQTEPIMTFDPFEEGWSYRKKVTIDHDLVEGDLSDFPVLVSIVDDDLRDKAQDDGDDILFMDGPGVANRLYHEIEFYDGSSGELVSWVRLSTIDGNTDTSFYIYYGNPDVTSIDLHENVWDEDFCAIWHLNDSKDSTSNKNHGITSGSSTNWKPGNSGIALEILNKGMVKNIPASFDNSISTEHTVNCWINWYGRDPNWPSPSYVFDARDHAYDGGFILLISEDGTVQFLQLIGSTYIRLKSASTISKNIWTHVSVVFNYNSQNLRIFINGIEDNSTIIMDYYHDTDLNPAMGNNHWAPIDGEYRPLNGILDELRVSKKDRGSDWISTGYNNQNDPSSFMSFGPEETGP